MAKSEISQAVSLYAIRSFMISKITGALFEKFQFSAPQRHNSFIMRTAIKDNLGRAVANSTVSKHLN
ncbi:hypothetical protein ACTXT7_002249 [Hymenolepis weldensis]